MGLDMYLEAEQYVSEYNEMDRPLHDAICEHSRNGLGEFRPTNVTYQLAYWRKANAIHAWFVKHVQEGKDECQRSHVSLEDLKTLKETCEKVLDNIELADELLPAGRGFFFGTYEYDERYRQDLANTVDQLDKILKTPNANFLWISYQASW